MKVLGLAVGLAVGALTWACSKLEPIDGTTVPKLGSEAAPPSCDQACRRVAALCGYEPVDCRTNCEADTAGEWRACLGQAATCRIALQDCVPPAPEDAGEDAEEDSGEEDASAEDAAVDAPSDDAPSDDAGDADTDAPTDAPKDAPDAG